MRAREFITESASPSQVWIDQVYSQYPDWPYGQADKVMVWGEGEDQQFAAFKLKPGTAPNTVEIDWIMAGPEQRKGVGSRAIKELQRQAQESGIRLTLYPWAKGNVSQASLTRLYKRHGFKPIAKGAKPMAWEPVNEINDDLRCATGIMEGLSQNQSQVRQTLNAWMNQDQQYEDPTQRAGFQAKVWPYIQKNIQSILSDKGQDGKGSYPAAPYAAWLLVQHMDAYPQNQASFLSALEQSGLDPTDGDGKNIGKLQFLRDRLAVNKWIAANANNKEYYVNGKPLPNPTVNVRNPAMFKDAGIVATSRDGALKNAIAAGNKLLVAAVQATNAQTQPSFKQGVNEEVNPMRQQAGQMIDKYFGQIYSYGDSGLDYLDNNAPTWYGLSDQSPPIVIGDGFILDGYHRANVAKALGIPTIRAYVGVKKVEEGYVRKLNFDEIYGKYLKITDNDGDPNKKGFSLVTPLNGASWNWRERPEFKDIVKRKLNQPGWLGDHKYQQIVDAMSGNKFDPAKHLVKEITAVPTVAKSKRQHLDVMPNDGRPIPRGEESDYMGNLVADMGNGYQLWSWTDRGTVTYYVFDTGTRTSQLGTTGRPYKTNRDSFVIQGVYSGPKNQYRAADLYAFLILNQGLTLVSDNKQSAGGYRVWQELERRYGRKINVHGFDTKTDQGVNVTTQDEPDTHVARADVERAGPKMKQDLASISRDLRFVASAR